jgi:hypothetical protein
MLKSNNTRKESLNYKRSNNLWNNVNTLLGIYKEDCPWIVYSYLKAKAIDKLKQTKYFDNIN